MRLLSLLVLFSGFCSKAQTSTQLKDEYIFETIALIKVALPDTGKVILLLSQPNTKGLDQCLNELLKDSAVLNEKERELIRSQAAKPLLNKWSQDVLVKSNLIEPEAVNNIFNTRRNSDAWETFYKKYGSGYYSFSAPIFLRNFTLCLFYTENLCGSLCGQGRVGLYRKINNKWILDKVYCRWIS